MDGPPTLTVPCRRGYRFRGPAHITDDPELIAILRADLGADYPISSAMGVSVEETRALISPIYWVSDASEGNVISKREGKLGYTLAATHEGSAG
jgi:hypothetical protein